MHHRVRLDGDDLRAGCVVAHVDAGAGAQLDNGALHRSDDGGLTLTPRRVAVVGAGFEQSRLEP